jgi:hypothetical protein
MTDHVISGLIRRRRELAGDLLQAMAGIDDISRDLAALDHTIRLFDPGIALDQIPALQSRPKPDWALRGEVVRIVFALLREADAPMPTREIVAAINRERGIEEEITFLQVKRVRKCLDRQRARGALRAVTINGRQCWEVG